MGLFSGMLFFMLYFLILSIGKLFGETGTFPPVIGMWTPNIIVGVIGFYIFIKVANEEPMLIDSISSFVKRLARK